jgi:dethiobiotin synthetase
MGHSMAKGLFITGTDTGCGKTEITLALMHVLQSRGLKVVGMKPVASGAVRIQAAGSVDAPYELINPFAYEPPIAPHIAAREAGRPVERGKLLDCYNKLGELADLVIVEGVGGWRVPLGEDLQVPDLPTLFDIPTLLVVGMRLGCLNHALLSADSIANSARLIGWVANQVEPDMARLQENLECLDSAITSQRLGLCPYIQGQTDIAALAAGLDAEGLLAALY